jgi:hypothetical protein
MGTDEVSHLRDRIDEDEVEEQLERCGPLLTDANARLGVAAAGRCASRHLHDRQLDGRAPFRLSWRRSSRRMPASVSS